MHASNIRGVIDQLDQLYADETLPPHHKLFSCMYRQVTVAVAEGIAGGRFDDPQRMDRFDTLFANRYLHALAQHRQGGRCAASWRVAFDFADGGGGAAFQHLLLGMNAHINLDLAIAAVAATPELGVQALRDDFERINQLLTEMLDGVQDALGAGSPALATLDRWGGRVDEALIGFSITQARQAAWRAAKRLARTPAHQRPAFVASLDAQTARLGSAIVAPGPLLGAVVRRVQQEESASVLPILEQIRAVRLGV